MRKLFVALFVILLISIGLGTGKVDASYGRCPQYESLLRANGLPRSFSSIMYRESRCNPAAVNKRSGARGLLQVMPQHVTRWHTCPGITLAALRTPSGNIRCAHFIYVKQGARAWALR